MENFSKLGDSIYFFINNGIYVNRYTSSRIEWKEKGLTITQNAELPIVKFTINGNAEGEIVLRVPDWCKEIPTVKINDEIIDFEIENGFITLDKEWSDGDEIEYTMHMQITVHPLADNKNCVAFKYGPYLLSADMGQDNMTTDVTGVNVTIPNPCDNMSDVLVIQNDTVENWLDNINENLVKWENELKFTLKGADRELVFSPHYKQHTSRYGIYFNCKA